MRSRMRPFALALGASLLLAPSLALSQVRAGGEFEVNTYTTSTQRWPQVGVGPGGDFVIVWQSDGQDGDANGIFARAYAADGNPGTPEFQVNSYTTGRQYAASVDIVGRYRTVVTWTSSLPTSDDVYMKLYGPRGEVLLEETRVNTYTTGVQRMGAVSAGPHGDFVVVWESNPASGEYQVMGQRFDRTGRRLGGEFHVSADGARYQVSPAVEVTPANGFVVAWTGYHDNDEVDVFARRFDATGSPLGLAFRVNTYTTSQQWAPGVAMAADGGFVLVWQSYGQDGSGQGVFGQRFDASGAALGGEFQVNTYTTGSQWVGSRVAADAAGNFVVTWTTEGQFGNGAEIMARRYSSSGVPRSDEFVVNTVRPGNEDEPELGVDDAGNFTIAWAWDGAGLNGIRGQRFGGLHPRECSMDPMGNNLLEPGETVPVTPYWKNWNGAGQTFSGTLGSIGGPAGCTQIIVDGTCDYGTVPNDVTATCIGGDSYVLSAGSTRCQQHWDVTAVESISPDTQGQQAIWTFHVGESFADVPKTSPFYRFIETLLHHGVTGGCGGTSYCPGNTTTRDQMAPFVLVALEAAGYSPPACTTPMFADVPASNPFCRFIEELARRGVVSGCGGGNYCPGNPVTREQMAVFVLRTLDPALDPQACVAGSEMFADVPASNPFCRWIEELARMGVVTGCGGGNYCPASPVTREQMGVFLSQTFGLTLNRP